jgi:hypothetical protein
MNERNKKKIVIEYSSFQFITKSFKDDDRDVQIYDE